MLRKQVSHSYSFKKMSVFRELGKRAFITVHIIPALNIRAVTQSSTAPLTSPVFHFAHKDFTQPANHNLISSNLQAKPLTHEHTCGHWVGLSGDS